MKSRFRFAAIMLAAAVLLLVVGIATGSWKDIVLALVVAPFLVFQLRRARQP